MPKKKPPHGYDDQKRPIWALNAEGQPICGRRKNKDGEPCQSTVRCDNGRCVAAGHGGNHSGRPLSDKPDEELHPTTLRRREAALRGMGIFDEVQLALTDPKILENLDNIVTIEGMINAKAAGLTPPIGLWKRSKELYLEAVENGNAQALKDLRVVLESGLTGAETEESILKLMDRQRKHRESEVRREAQSQQTMNFTTANWFLSQILAVLKEVIFHSDTPRERIPIEVAGRLERKLRGNAAGEPPLHVGAELN